MLNNGLKDYYAGLHESAIVTIKQKGFSLDAELGSPTDHRRLTLLLRPNQHIKDTFYTFISKSNALIPGQYCYPPTDIHVTIMPIISCYEAFSLTKLDLSIYDQLIKNALEGISRIEIQFEGVFLSPSCLIIKGFPRNEQLKLFRQNLRDAFATSNVEQSLDKRYQLVTAHSTVLRFIKPVEEKERIFELIDAFKDFDFGKQYFDQVKFVYNDWYQSNSIVKDLNTYLLPA